MTEDPRIEAWYSTESRWQKGLLALRALLRETPLAENLNWRGPCYGWQGGNVAMPWRMKESFGLSFFKGVLLDDPDRLLEPPGPNSRFVRMMRFTASAEVAPASPALRGFLAQALHLEQSGQKVIPAPGELDLPEEIGEAFAEDPDLAAAFDALTPGRRRGYLLHFTQAKQAATRRARLEKWAPHIRAGKGMHDR
jgi:uncharacterized protein YdeI (YjbR/CyaY-like superfamily)